MAPGQWPSGPFGGATEIGRAQSGWHVEHLCFPAVLSKCFLLTLKENGAAADLTGAILRPKRVSGKEERSSFQCQIRSFKCSL